MRSLLRAKPTGIIGWGLGRRVYSMGLVGEGLSVAAHKEKFDVFCENDMTQKAGKLLIFPTPPLFDAPTQGQEPARIAG